MMCLVDLRDAGSWRLDIYVYQQYTTTLMNNRYDTPKGDQDGGAKKSMQVEDLHLHDLWTRVHVHGLLCRHARHRVPSSTRGAPLRPPLWVESCQSPILSSASTRDAKYGGREWMWRDVAYLFHLATRVGLASLVHILLHFLGPCYPLTVWVLFL